MACVWVSTEAPSDLSLTRSGDEGSELHLNLEAMKAEVRRRQRAEHPASNRRPHDAEIDDVTTSLSQRLNKSPATVVL